MSTFPDKFSDETYIYPNCIHNNNSSFHHFISRAASCMFDMSQDLPLFDITEGKSGAHCHHITK